MLNICFSKNKSLKFDKARKLALEFDTVNDVGGEIVIVTNSNEIYRKFETYQALLEIISSWKQFYLVVNSAKIADYKKKRDIFYLIQQIVSCIRYASPNSNNDFCCQLESVRLGFSNSHRGVPWYFFGKLMEGLNYEIDHSEIYMRLLEEGNTKHLCLCPFFDNELIRNNIAKYTLSKIDLSDRNMWSYRPINKIENGVIRRDVTDITYIGNKRLHNNYFHRIGYENNITEFGDINKPNEFDYSGLSDDFLEQALEEFIKRKNK